MRHLVLLAVALSSLYLAHAKCCAGGVWSAWAPSGKCSDTCGSCGKITYTRTCISARNGCPCSGPVRKTNNCNLMPCKYPRNSCCGKMKALVKGEKVFCGPQPVDRIEAPGPAPGTPCSAPPRPPPPSRPRTTKKITKATMKPTTTGSECGGPPAEGSITTAPAPPCPAGWNYCPGASHCYKWTDGEFTQPEAQSKCQELGGNLATIDSVASTQCLIDYATKTSQKSSSAWIGLVDTTENVKHTANCTCWKWLDGSPYNYENFAPGQPNNAEAKEWCTEIFLPASNYPAGTWNDELCKEYARPAVCSVPANPTRATNEPATTKPFKTSTPLALTTSIGSTASVASTTALATTTQAPPCPAGWGYCPGASHCYKLVDGEFTQPEAQARCRELGGNLATVGSTAATQCLIDYAAKSLQEAHSAWIGLVDTVENANHTKDCSCWKWLDGSTYSYETFAPGEPNNSGGKEWCTEFYLARSGFPVGTWNDKGCEALKRPAVCSVPANPTQTTLRPSSTSTTTAIATTTQAPPCPAGWGYCPGTSHCYKLVDGGFTQPEAQQRCRELGGNLAIVDSAAATQCLLDYASKSSQQATSAWIGLVDKAENSKHTANCTCWKWFDDSPFNYENFAPGQPNNAEAKEWCSEVFLPASNYPAGTWNDELCDAYKRPAVCSVPANPTTATASTRLALTARTVPMQSVSSSTTPATTTKTAASSTTKTPPCPDGWSYCPGASHCYKLVDGGFTQPEAQLRCREIGGSLATVNSPVATQCLIDSIAKTSQGAYSAWIGLVDAEKGTKHAADCSCWKWLDGSTYSYQNFAAGEPNNAKGNEWCTEFYLPASSYPVGTWNDEGCEDATRPALCSVPANGPDDAQQTTRPVPAPTEAGTSKLSTPATFSMKAEPTPSSTSPVGSTTIGKATPCPDGWYYCPGAPHCFKFIDGGYTQPEAQSRCRELGGSLASIGTVADTQCLVDYAAIIPQGTYSAWIGLVDSIETASHTADCACWNWLDGSPYNYQNFQPGEPNNLGGKEWCTEVYLPASGQPVATWNDMGCSSTRPAMCSVSANGSGDALKTTGPALASTTAGSSKLSTPPTPSTKAVTTPASTNSVSSSTMRNVPPCPDGWHYCPGAVHCFKTVDGGYTQPEAQSRCRELGGNLASISTAADTQCIVGYAAIIPQGTYSAWIGLVDSIETASHTADCACWKWLDGSPHNYQNFQPGEPNNLGGKEWCTEVYLPASGQPVATWNDMGCNYTRPALCSVPANGIHGLHNPTAVPTRAAGQSTPLGSSKPTAK